MDPSDLLEYALGRLDGPRRERIERRIVRDPVLAERVARLIRNLGRLLDDGQGHCSPERSPFASPTRQDSVSRAQSEDGGDRPPSGSR